MRKVTSSLAGETLAMVATIGEMVYIKATLQQLYGRRIEKLPTVIVTDSRNLTEAIASTSLVGDSWLRTDIAVIQEAVERGAVTRVKWVSSEDNLANCLTKAGAMAAGLLEVLRKGEYILPGGWD